MSSEIIKRDEMIRRHSQANTKEYSELNIGLSGSSPHSFLRLGALLLSVIASGVLGGGCGSNVTLKLEGRQRTIVVPTHAVVQPERQSDGSAPPRRYVVRMSDGNLDWEVELPEVATGYELRIPFKGQAPAGTGELTYQNSAALTAADKELISSLRRENPDLEREGVYNGRGEGIDTVNQTLESQDQKGAVTQDGVKGQVRGSKSSSARQSYLVGLEKARQLFKARKYELAIIALKSLDGDYPNDITIKSMLGTLWLQLNQPTLARESWEAALKINPNHRAVIEALKQLQSSVEGTEGSANE